MNNRFVGKHTVSSEMEISEPRKPPRIVMT